MFNYRQSGPFQTPSAGHSTSRRIGRRALNSIQEDAQIYSAMKPSKLDVNQRVKRRFGTNLTNKRPISRLHTYDLSKTQQIYKPSKPISFASRAPAAPQSTFKYDLRGINEQKTGLEEPEYCPSGSSWRESIDSSLHRIVQKAFTAIGSFKLFVAADKTYQMDCDIPERFEEIQCPSHRMTLPFLYDTDSDDTEDEVMTGNGDDIDIPLIDEEVEDMVLECPCLDALEVEEFQSNGW